MAPAKQRSGADDHKADAAAASKGRDVRLTGASREQIQWMEFERDVLHAYVRTYQIESPSAFSNDLHRWMLSQPGSIGLQSPTMRRHKALRRQSKAQLASTTRKHSNNLGVQENDVIVDFLHKVQNHEVVRLRRLRRNGSNSRGREG
ncbi:hypothetical protein CMQ_1262 [Grosmannia clavigera kw1407]|uniref:Histone deacetylase complex subunit SAP30 Sin3 binding domain-containing protein n=1 Tax=Grosmannia clavigera (strain kw1407 / UAMH 11150) TaxID=655863 RepID=F0XFK4_GROCL|nr:uncharacterized protein CMQ_1262 [Grosmannia clavigera kw1407]EFX04334.1 hypothetical protein CMQ_1262 [Grosmannia clavigera kw1407]